MILELARLWAKIPGPVKQQALEAVRDIVRGNPDAARLNAQLAAERTAVVVGFEELMKRRGKL